MDEEKIKKEETTITYSEFTKLDMRLGRVVVAEALPDSDKLIRFEIDFGEEKTRQILSAIREWYIEPETLVGKTMLFVVNLEPRTIRGFESRGMLMAVGEDKPIFLVPEEGIAPGAKVR
ncbi:MAG: methionine--tRNA ligase [Candidatus Pacebacteria bacterium]|nr:methionine--tRNA ligase [Candidatus Paceibacterota bacterium]